MGHERECGGLENQPPRLEGAEKDRLGAEVSSENEGGISFNRIIMWFFSIMTIYIGGLYLWHTLRDPSIASGSENPALVQQQREFIRVVSGARSQYLSGSSNPINEAVLREELRRNRSLGICQIIGSGEVHGWRGQVRDISLVSQLRLEPRRQGGRFIELTVDVGDGILVSTTVGLYGVSMYGENNPTDSMISFDSAMGSVLREVRIGSYVEFSGRFFMDRRINSGRDLCVWDSAPGIDDSMRNPKFIFQFMTLKAV